MFKKIIRVSMEVISREILINSFLQGKTNPKPFGVDSFCYFSTRLNILSAQ
jgi:hypothetical protein